MIKLLVLAALTQIPCPTGACPQVGGSSYYSSAQSSSQSFSSYGSSGCYSAAPSFGGGSCYSGAAVTPVVPVVPMAQASGCYSGSFSAGAGSCYSGSAFGGGGGCYGGRSGLLSAFRNRGGGSFKATTRVKIRSRGSCGVRGCN
jgi:hypothetical protein